MKRSYVKPILIKHSQLREVTLASGENNGFGNGDQDAPGNSGDHNNAENANGDTNNP
jgi:hypothetical protein